MLFNGETTDLVIFSFAEAIDTVGCNLLYLKLDKYYVIDIDWLSQQLDFVRCCRQRGVWSGYHRTGCVSGLKLGPILFLLFVKDLHQNQMQKITIIWQLLGQIPVSWVSMCLNVFLRQLTGKAQVTCSTYWPVPAIWEYCHTWQVLKMVKREILYVCTGFQGIHKMMCYVSMHVFKTNMPILISNAWNINIKIYETMIPFRMIFNTIVFYYECCKSGRKRKGWSGMGGNSKSGKISLIHVGVLYLPCYLNWTYNSVEK